MKVFFDVFSGDEIITDAYHFKYVHNNAGVEVRSKFISIEQIDEGGEVFDHKVLDLMNQFHYKEFSFTKKDFIDYIKAYQKKVKAHLEQTNPERVPGYMEGVTQMTKYILGIFEQITFYSPESYNMNDAIIMSYYKDGDDTPTFLYMIDGLKANGQ